VSLSLRSNCSTLRDYEGHGGVVDVAALHDRVSLDAGGIRGYSGLYKYGGLQEILVLTSFGRLVWHHTNI
jgi:hypothetical protein